jgi:hypothetical protein
MARLAPLRQGTARQPSRSRQGSVTGPVRAHQTRRCTVALAGVVARSPAAGQRAGDSLVCRPGSGVPERARRAVWLRFPDMATLAVAQRCHRSQSACRRCRARGSRAAAGERTGTRNFPRDCPYPLLRSSEARRLICGIRTLQNPTLRICNPHAARPGQSRRVLLGPHFCAIVVNVVT